MSNLYLPTTEALAQFCAEAKVQGRLALDTEFHRERRYYPQLALVQLATKGAEALLDPLNAQIDLAPLGEILLDASVEKILHAPSQDLEIFYLRFGACAPNVFDTQTAAAMLGMGAQLSLSGLVERVLGVRLAKGQSFTDWLRRPLSPDQERYAVEDVKYLLDVHDGLLAELRELGREDWLREELLRFEDSTLYIPAPETLYTKVKRFRSLEPRKLAVLRELAIWRETRARENDRNRRAIAADEVLVEIARAGPRDLKALGRTRGLHNETVSREGAAIIAAVERGQAVPDTAWPRPNEHRPAVDGAELATAIVQAFLKVYCQELRIDSSMVGTTADVERLVADYAEGNLASSDAPLLKGWRGELVGERVVAFLRGELAVRLEPGTVRPIFESVVS